MIGSVSEMIEDAGVFTPNRSNGWSRFSDSRSDVVIPQDHNSTLPWFRKWKHSSLVETGASMPDDSLQVYVERYPAAVSFRPEMPSSISPSWVLKLREWAEDLEAICQEAITEDWDGEGATCVQRGARRYALLLVFDLDEGTRLPEVSVDPDGEISLRWHVDQDVYSISISDSGRLSYAGLFGLSECHGTEWMVERPPEAVKRPLSRLLLEV